MLAADRYSVVTIESFIRFPLKNSVRRQVRASGADLTFARHLLRLPYANVKSKAPLASIVCQWSFDSKRSLTWLRRWGANVGIGPPAPDHEPLVISIAWPIQPGMELAICGNGKKH